MKPKRSGRERANKKQIPPNGESSGPANSSSADQSQGGNVTSPTPPHDQAKVSSSASFQPAKVITVLTKNGWQCVFLSGNSASAVLN